MRRTGKNNNDKVFLENLGKAILQMILDCGYHSPYEFWQKKAQGHLSKTTLTYIINGKIDPKITTLEALARLLDTDIKCLLEKSEYTKHSTKASTKKR